MNVREIPSRDIKKYTSASWVDTTRKPYVYGETAYIPVKDGYPYSGIIPERKRRGRGFQKIGPIIAFHGSEPLDLDINEVIRLHNPQAIIWYRGHKGDMRIPDTTTLYGVTGDILHKESGIKYHLDPTRVMFSQGNRKEKKRIANLVQPGEQVCDMFAGIGYFTLPLAKAGAHVHAIEINPDSITYLKKNILENKLTSRITVTQGDCRDNLAGPYDRIHMGFYEAVRFLSIALDHVQSGTMLHVHGIGNTTEKIERILMESGHEATCQHLAIKKIGPGKVHTVTDVRIS